MVLMFRVLLTAVCVVLLSGCAPNVLLTRGQVSQLSSGASKEEVEGAIASATPSANYSFETQGKKFDVRHFAMLTGTTTSYIPVCTPVCYTVPVTVPVTVPYVVVLNNETQTLFAWGTIEELSKSPDQNVSDIAPALKDAYASELARKK